MVIANPPLAEPAIDPGGVIIVGRIDPVECIFVSQQRNGNVRNVKPPAMRVRDVCYTKNHLSITIEVFRPLCKKGKVILWQSKQIRSHILHGLSEREKRINDVRQACKPEVQIWEPPFLVRGILCQYSRAE